VNALLHSDAHDRELATMEQCHLRQEKIEHVKLKFRSGQQQKQVDGGLFRSLVLSLFFHSAAAVVWVMLLPRSQPQSVQWVEFRLITPPDDQPPEPPVDPDIRSMASAEAAGPQDPLQQEQSVGGSAAASPLSAANEVMAAQPLQSLSQTLWLNHLQQAVAAQDWPQALTLVQNWQAEYPDQRPDLHDYQAHLEKLVAASSRSVPPPTSGSISPPSVQSPVVPPVPVTTPPLQVQKGTGGTISGLANTDQPSPGPANLSAVADLQWGAYLAHLQTAIQQQWLIQSTDHDSHLTRVNLTLRADGSLEDIRVAVSSGDDLVDSAVVSSIRRAAPFQPLPEGTLSPSLTFRLDILSGRETRASLVEPE
jgi:protein TonB